MVIINYIAFILLAIGGLNWGLVGIFNFNLVESIFGVMPSAFSIIIYVLVFLSALWLIFSIIYHNGILYFTENNR